MNHFNYGIIIGAIESAPLLGAYAIAVRTVMDVKYESSIQDSISDGGIFLVDFLADDFSSQYAVRVVQCR